MKILFLTNIPSPYRVDFFNEFGKYVDLSVLYERKSASDRNEKWISAKALSYKEIFLKGIEYKKDTAFCTEVIKHINRKSYDFFIVGGYSTPTAMYAIEYMHIKGIPFIMSADGGFVKSENKLKCKMKRHFIGQASFWLSSGSVTSKYLIHYGAKKERIFNYPFTSIWEKDIVNSPITKEEKFLIRKSVNIKEEYVVISIGQFIHRKGFDILISAAGKLGNNVGIYIIGGTPTREYERIIEEQKISNVHFVGFMEKGELADYYKMADVFAFSTREDIWGLVVNEAMAHGLPVITTNRSVAGLEMVTENENGYIIPVEDAEILARRIQELLEDTEKRMHMSQKCLQTIRYFTIENMAKVHYEILKKLG